MPTNLCAVPDTISRGYASGVPMGGDLPGATATIRSEGPSFLVSAMQDAGTPLVKLLEWGQWATPAFLKYVDLQFLERDIVIQAHDDESSSDSDC